MMGMYFLPSAFTNNAAKNILVIFNFFWKRGRIFLYGYLNVKLLDVSKCIYI